MANIQPKQSPDYKAELYEPLRKYLRRGVSVEAKITAAASSVTSVMALVAKKNAPMLLLEIITISRTVVDEPSFVAFTDHMAALYVHLLIEERQMEVINNT